MIHPTAIVEDGVQLGVDCEIHAHAIVRRGTILRERVVIHPFAVVGGDPQDLKFDRAAQSGVRVGAGTTVREHVTISRSTHPGSFTEVGENCLLMASCHIAHDCVVGNNVILANGALMAGHVRVDDYVFLSGCTVLHQFIRVGESAMVGGGSQMGLDLPPFVLAANRNEVVGLNLVGLHRRGFSRAVIGELKKAFRTVYFTPGNIRAVAAQAFADGEFSTAEARRFLKFFAGGKRGFARPRRGAAKDKEQLQEA